MDSYSAYERERRLNEERLRRLYANSQRVASLNTQLNRSKPQAAPPQQSFFNKVRDVFDANTPSDVYRRQQAGQAANYAQQQKDRGIGRIANNPWERTLNLGKNVGETIADPYKKIGTGLSTAFGEGAKLRAYQEANQKENLANIESLQKQLQAPTTSLADRAKIRSRLAIAGRNRDIQFGNQMGEFKRLQQDADPLKMAGSIAQAGTDLAGLGVAGFAGKEFGANLAKFGFREAAKRAIPAVGANAALNTVQGGIGELQSDNPTLAGAARKAGLGLTIGTAADLVVGGLPALMSNRAYKNVVKDLAGESDSLTIRDTLKSISKDLPEERINTIAKEIADTTDETAVDGILKKAAREEADLVGGKVSNIDIPATKPVTTTTDTVLSEDVVKAFTGTKTPQQVRDSINALFPELDETTKVRITQEIAQSTDEKTTRQILEQAQAQRKALTEGVQNVTPQAEALPPTQEQQIAQAAQEQPQAQLTSNQAPDPNIEANQVIAQANPTQAAPVVPGATNPNVVPDTEVLFGNAPQMAERSLSIPQKLSPDRLIRENITQPLERGVNKLINTAQTSSNPIARGLGRLTQGISREAGVSPELLAQKRLLRGGVETGKLIRESVSGLGDGLTKEAKTKVWSTLDPERAAELGVKVAKTAELTPEEAAYRTALVQVRDYTTQENLARGLITPEQAANPDYLKRGYSVFEEGSDYSKVYSQTRDSLLKPFKGRKDVNEKLVEEAITDPGYLVAKKSAESHAAWAMVDYAKYLTDSGLVSDVEKAGYRQLPTSKLFGEASGKFVPVNIAEDFTGFQYNNGMMSAFNDLITAYDSLGIRKAKKELLTVFNPAVRGGNQVSNRLIFSNMNGINPLQFNKAYIEVGKDIAEKSQIYREAVAQGLTGIDITQADFAARISDYVDDPNIAKKAVEWTKKSYSAADDKARVAAFKVWRERGYSANDAAALVQRGFQDYKSVGFFYDIAAKTPLIGNAFVRFAGDSIRIAKNAALDHPLRTAATVALWANMVNVMSKVSGESPEDKATREGRFGAPTLPGTNISLTVQTPWGEVNAARFLPFYQLNDVQSAVGRFLPIQGNPLTPQGWQDPLLGQFGQLATDSDFRGKSIADPKNTVDDQGNKRYVDELPQKERNLNRARFFGVQNLPLGRETDQILSAIKGAPDQYGKIRSVPQAVLRSGGIKVEQFGAQQAKDQRATNDYFKERDRINAEIKNLPRADQEAYKRLTGYYKLREQTDNTFKPGTKRDLKAPVYEFSEDKWKDYTSHPGLYELQVKEKVNASKPKPDGSPGVPLQPEFNPLLSEGFRKQLINNKSLAPGENVEANARMYNDPEWDKYQQLKDQYKSEAAQYYPQSNGEFTDELVKHQQAPFPKKGAAKQAYDDAYKAYAEGKGAKPAFTDAVAADKEAYNDAQWRWTNNERKARGLPPIPKKDWDNVTFGFQSDEERVYNELKYGKGYGGYGRGGYGRFGRSGGSSKKEKTPKTYIGTLLGDAPSVSSNEISIKTAPTRAKFKVKTPSGKGRNYKKIKLG